MRNDAATVPAGSAEKTEAHHGASKRHAFLVAAGIFLSRIAGLVRQRIFAHYFGNSDAADAFNAAFRIPTSHHNSSDFYFANDQADGWRENAHI